MIITSTAVLNFVGQLSPEFRYRLLNQTDPGRLISLMEFKDFLNREPRPIKKLQSSLDHFPRLAFSF
jgi:hypothetical protein